MTLMSQEIQSGVEEYDLLVVGGGKAGKSLAMDQAKKGKRVAMVEREYVGGTCINVACIPTKSLVASARRLLDARSNADFGVSDTQAARINLTALREHKESVVGGMVAGHEKLFAASGMDFIRGTATFVGPRTVSVALHEVDGVDPLAGGAAPTRTITAPKVLVNLGTRPARPAVPGLWEAGAWTSEDILRLEEIPSSLVVVGGGYIGVEFASMMSTFGSKVTLIASGEHALPREDADLAAEVEATLVSNGVEIVHNSRAVSAQKVAQGIEITLTDGSTVTAERVLVAAGRTPNTDGIGLEAAGIDVDSRGMIVVDDHLRTSAEGVWAAGDSAGTPMFTHASWNDFRIVRAQLEGASLDDPSTTKAGRVMPWTVFATPELARIGIDEEEAAARGLDVLVAKIPIGQIPRAKTMRVTNGLWKAVVDASTHKILGASLLGPDSGEVITAVQVAMEAGFTYEHLRRLPITHPTMGEGLNVLFDQLP